MSLKNVKYNDILSSTIPILMGYIPLGMVFGFLMVQNGAEWWHAPLMSLVVFAGAAQFLAIGMLSVGASISEIAAAVTIVNLRHVFYGISVVDIMPRSIFAKIYFISALTDENYSLLSEKRTKVNQEHPVIIMMVNHFYWVSGALIGSFMGAGASIKIDGLEFSLTALFTVLAVEQYKRIKKIMYPFIAIISYMIAIYFFPGSALFISIALAVIIMIAGSFMPSSTLLYRSKI